jgi:hypothetical protein
MLFETTPETLLELVRRFKIDEKFTVSENFDIDKNKVLKEGFFTDDEIEELESIRKIIVGTYSGFWTWTWTSGEAENIVKLKKKLGFEEGSETTYWVKKSDNLNKEAAKKFFFQRLLLHLIEEEKFLNKKFTFQGDLNADATSQEMNLACGSPPSNSKVDVKLQDLWLCTKFNQLKEEEEIPEDYEYKSFVGVVRSLILGAEATNLEAEDTENPKVTVNTQYILDYIMFRTLSEYKVLNNKMPTDQKKLSWLSTKFEKLKNREDLPFKSYSKEFFFAAVKEAITRNGGQVNHLNQIMVAADEIKPEYDYKFATRIQTIYRGYKIRREPSATEAKEGSASQEFIKLKKQLRRVRKIRTKTKIRIEPSATEAKEGSASQEFIKLKKQLQGALDRLKSSDPTLSQEIIKLQKQLQKALEEAKSNTSKWAEEISKTLADNKEEILKLKKVSDGAKSSDPALSQEIIKLQKELQEALEEAKSNTSKWAEEISKTLADNKEEILKLKKVSDGAKSSDPTQSQWKTDGTRDVTYQYLVDNNYVRNGKNHYLIPEIRGRGLEAVTQYATGLPVFNYKDLNEFSQDAAEAGKEEWNKKDNRLLSSIACIGEGEDKRYCVVTSSVRGVTKTFISQTEFNKITSEATLFYEACLESVIKTSALDETLGVLNAAKERYNKDSQGTLSIIKSIDDEIDAIKVRKAYMSDLMTKSEYSEDSREDSRLAYLHLYNNLDIKIPEEIKFNEDETSKFETAKSKTVVDDNSYNAALETFLKTNAACCILDTLEVAKKRLEEEAAGLLKQSVDLAAVALKESAIKEIKEYIKYFEKEKPLTTATFPEQQQWYENVVGGLMNMENTTLDLLNEDEYGRIKKILDQVINAEDKEKEVAEKLIAVGVDEINWAKKLFDEEFGIKTLNRQEKLEKASEKEKQAARHLASCSYSHKMAKTVERSIENEVINGLDTFEVKSIAEDFANAHVYEGEDKEAYAKDVRKLLKAPLPHANLNGVGFHRPRGTSIVSVAFNYSEVGHEGELTGNTEAYPYIDGSYHCYIGCRVCKKDGMKMTVWKDGKAVADKEYKRGDTVIDQNTISFLDPKTQKYTPVEASPASLKAHLESMKESGNPYPGSVESIMAQYKKMQIKVTSQVNNATAKEPDIERKVSIMHKGETLSYNADDPQTTIGKKKVVTEAWIINKEGELEQVNDNSFGKIEEGQPQFVKMNEILLPDGASISLYVKLSNNNGEVICESEPCVECKDPDGGKKKFTELTSDNIKDLIKKRASHMDEDDIEEEAAKLFNRAVNDCKNTKLILPLANDSNENYKIYTPTDVVGAGRGDTDNKPCSTLFGGRPKAIKLGDVNKLATVPEVGIVKRVIGI